MELLHCYTRVTLLHSCYTVTLVELAYHPFSLGGGLGVTARAVSWRPPTGGCRTSQTTRGHLRRRQMTSGDVASEMMDSK
eukprot:1186119-Prorocentrum_minimum.AAC.2